MKKLNQKQWGIFGTSLGSVLIIVALLTMVGIGSGDTYAAGTAINCSCASGTWVPNTTNCTTTINKTFACTCPSGYKMDSSGTCISTTGTGKSISCTCTDGTQIPNSTDCTASIKQTTACTCPTGYTIDSSGTCTPKSSTPTSCSSGEYISGSTCELCQSGSYCPGDGKIYSCPANATCSATAFVCNTGYEKNSAGTACVKICSEGEYKSGSTCELCQSGSYCPGDGKIYSCPTNATCSASSFTCNTGYHKSGNICAADTGTNIGNCPAGTYYQGLNHAATCTEKYYCPGGTYNANTGDIIQGCERIACPENATCPAGSSDFTCNTGYSKNSAGTACVKNGNGNPNGGNGDNGNNNNPNGGNGNNGGSGTTGGNTGGNNNGNNSNTNNNPSTATKTPLVIVVIGMIAMGLGTFTYYKSKNNEI